MDEHRGIINFLLIAGVIQGFLFNIITLIFGKKYDRVIIYLNLIVFFISMNNLQAWLTDNDYRFDSFYWRHMLIPWYIFVFACFHNFLRHYLGVTKAIPNYFKMVALIFLVEVVLRLGAIFLADVSLVSDPDQIIEYYNIFEEIVNISICISLFYLSFRLVFYKDELYKAFLDYDDIKWIKVFIILGIAICITWSTGLLIRIINGHESQNYYPMRLVSSILLYWIGYQGLYRYTLSQDRILLRKSIRKSNGVTPLKVLMAKAI